MKIGIMGCGNISNTYFEMIPTYKGLEVVAGADILIEAAEGAAQKYGVKALSVEDLLADESIDLVVNLTVPASHCETSCRILESGKHAYSEKPLALSMAEAKKIAETAMANGKEAGCAPDTFFGGAHQLARAAIDDGEIGDITSGTCHVMSPGMEMWHPNPDFFFQPGGGPVLDLGPYYIADLINLVGPVKRVAAMENMAWEERTITSEPRAGEKVKVEVATTLQALLEFSSGAKITLTASWDVWHHNHSNIELYGTEGTIYVPDPNFFNGDVKIVKKSSLSAENPSPEPVALPDEHPLSVPNQKHGPLDLANYRGVGLAEMVVAIVTGKEPRCSIMRAMHSLEVMTAILTSGREGRFIDLETTCERPAPFTAENARSLMA